MFADSCALRDYKAILFSSFFTMFYFIYNKQSQEIAPETLVNNKGSICVYYHR